MIYIYLWVNKIYKIYVINKMFNLLSLKIKNKMISTNNLKKINHQLALFNII
jgi:hypothetical protein